MRPVPRRRTGGSREEHMKRGAGIDDRLDGDRSFVPPDNRMGGRQTEPAAGFPGDKVGLEDAADLLRRNSLAEIADRDPHVAPGPQSGNPAPAKLQVGGGNFDPATGRRRMCGVNYQVAQAKIQLAKVHVHGMEVRRHFKLTLNLELMQRLGNRVFNRLLDPGGAPDGRPSFGEGQQVTGNLPRPQ
jgi:hypothetical protein